MSECLKKLATQCVSTKNKQAKSALNIPQLATFEQLLTTIDVESENKSQNANTAASQVTQEKTVSERALVDPTDNEKHGQAENIAIIPTVDTTINGADSSLTNEFKQHVQEQKQQEPQQEQRQEPQWISPHVEQSDEDINIETKANTDIGLENGLSTETKSNNNNIVSNNNINNNNNSDNNNNNNIGVTDTVVTSKSSSHQANTNTNGKANANKNTNRNTNTNTNVNTNTVSNNNNNNNNNNNGYISGVGNDYSFNFDLRTLRDYVELINMNIEMKTDLQYRHAIFSSLFEGCGIGSAPSLHYKDYYIVHNNIIKLLETNFWGIKRMSSNASVLDRNMLEKGLSKYNQMNLHCVQFVLKHRIKLQRYIRSILRGSSSGARRDYRENINPHNYTLSQFFQHYIHQCKNKNDYFTTNGDYFHGGVGIYINRKYVDIQLIDLLRNLLFQMGTVYNFIAYTKISRPVPDENSKSMVKLISKLLYLKLVDTSIQANGITLYHYFVYQKQTDYLKCLLKAGQCDWSILKDGNNQVELLAI